MTGQIVSYVLYSALFVVGAIAYWVVSAVFRDPSRTYDQAP